MIKLFLSPAYKAGESSDLTNCIPIYVRACFSKILERIMYNYLLSYVPPEKSLYLKQFDFQSDISTKHANPQLANQIYEPFGNKLFTVGTFIDWSKTFDTVNHPIILKKLEIYDIHRKNRKWFKSCLGNRKEHIQIDDKYQTDFWSVACGVPQGLILGPLLFLFCVNDLPNASKILDSTTFADDTSPILSNCNIPVLSPTVISELSKINQSFLANRLSLS